MAEEDPKTSPGLTFQKKEIEEGITSSITWLDGDPNKKSTKELDSACDTFFKISATPENPKSALFPKS